MLRTRIFSETVSLKPLLHLGPSCNNPANSSSKVFCSVVILPGSPRSPLHTDLLACVFTLVSFFFFFSSSFPRSRAASSLFFVPQRISAASCRQDTFFKKKEIDPCCLQGLRGVAAMSVIFVFRRRVTSDRSSRCVAAAPPRTLRRGSAEASERSCLQLRPGSKFSF